jgi:hypothetical protein
MEIHLQQICGFKKNIQKTVLFTGFLLSYFLTCVGCNSRLGNAPLAQAGAIRVQDTKMSLETNSLPLKHLIVPPADFIRHIRSADNITITSRFNRDDRFYKDFKFVLDANRTREVVNAILLLKIEIVEGEGYTMCNCEDWQLEFFCGTNSIGIANFGGYVVLIDQEYSDKTGFFEKISDEVTDKFISLLPSN